MELRNALETATGSSLPGTLVFDYPTVDSLACYLAGLTAPGEPSAPNDAGSSGWELGAAYRNLPVVTVGAFAARVPDQGPAPEAPMLGGACDAVSLTPLSRCCAISWLLFPRSMRVNRL